MIDLLLPSTDAGVAAQGATAIAVLTVAGLAARRHPEVLWLVAGVATLLAGLFGLRALH